MNRGGLGLLLSFYLHLCNLIISFYHNNTLSHRIKNITLQCSEVLANFLNMAVAAFKINKLLAMFGSSYELPQHGCRHVRNLKSTPDFAQVQSEVLLNFYIARS
ncbi:MAG: hypothetical protein IJA07_11730, partial [Agathobacter sp.]|nr:hypothetical protein [Agathobacter sp.]